MRASHPTSVQRGETGSVPGGAVRRSDSEEAEDKSLADLREKAKYGKREACEKERERDECSNVWR